MTKNNQSKLEELTRQLEDTAQELAKESATELNARRVTLLRKTLGEIQERLCTFLDELDPIKDPGFVFDPANPVIAGRIVAITMISQPRKPMENVAQFYGSGIYAIYYNGSFAPYSKISKMEHPIYVGKANPEGLKSMTAKEQGPKLSMRLQEHRRTIRKAAETLRIEDFEYRALVVQTGWQEAAESYLIELFKPLWNKETRICYGFGKHGDDPGTRGNARSPWDTLHAGRAWAHRDPNMEDAHTLAAIKKRVADHLKENPPFKSIDQILRRFLNEMRDAT